MTSGFIIHLRVDADSMPHARTLAVEVLDQMHALQPELDVVNATVSEEGRECFRHFVICGEWIDRDANQRCVRIFGHGVDHTPEWPE